jgi:membrane-bound serine protease (ClpP class)
MVTLRTSRPPRAAPSSRVPAGWLLVGLAALLLLPARPGARGEDAPREERPTDGIIVRVPATISTEGTNRLRSQLLGPLKRFETTGAPQGGTFKVLCDFNADGRRSECNDYGAAYSLATYLRSLTANKKGVHTIAYVHGEVRRHSVLPVLACSEVVMSGEARLGKVTAPGETLPADQRAKYDEVTRNRFAPALIRKMYDPNVEVIHARDGGYRDANERPRPVGEPVPELARGDTALYSFKLARDVGLCQQTPYESVDDVRIAYGLPRTTEQRSLDHVVCWRIPVSGAITGELKEQVQRRIERALRDRANVIVLELECGDGHSEKAYELGLYLANLNAQRGEDAVETIAFVTNKARNTAAFLAFGCRKIVMQKEVRDGNEVVQQGARLGDFEHYLQSHPDLEGVRKELDQLSRRPGQDPKRRQELERRLADGVQGLEETLRKNLADIAGRHFYPTALAEGMFSRDMTVWEVERLDGRGGRTCLSDEQLQARQDKGERWKSLGMVKDGKDHQYLTLTAEKAVELGVAQGAVKDFEGLCELEGLNPQDVHLAKSDWLDGLADFLRDPWTSVILVMVGITCLILELKMPGVGLPGVIAAICFVLFFWSHSQLHGQITWLAVLLFALGLLLIGLEIFVLPGLGVAGISGVLLVLASLGLVVYGHWPRSNQEWVTFGHKISPFGISMLGALLAAFLLARYLPSIPFMNRLMLRPQEETEAGEPVPDNPVHAELAALLGAIGVAATPLRPAGKVQFGDTFVDVLAEGSYVMPGTRVQVIEVEGNRVVVKEV